jgi:hypothetical protein
MGLLTPISLAACPKARAGIQTLWAITCEKVEDLTFSVDREITAITLVIDTPANVWVKIEFEENTAFLNQEKTRNKSAVSVRQQIQFIEPGLSTAVRNALEDLNLECCLHVIVQDNSNNFHYCGISYDVETAEWFSDKMKTGAGSSNTNSDPAADQAEYTESLESNSLFYAPFWTLGTGGIVV